jgi:hypothetical protein
VNYFFSDIMHATMASSCVGVASPASLPSTSRAAGEWPIVEAILVAAEAAPDFRQFAPRLGASPLFPATHSVA